MTATTLLARTLSRARACYLPPIAATPALEALLKDSSLVILEEMETSRGVAWTARLTIGDAVLDVENTGDGGPNRYSMAQAGWRGVDAATQRVVTTIPDLVAGDPLDLYCVLVELYQDAHAELDA